ncbi:Alpha-tocopherol transfer protein-like protein, partial [Stegodyphus mimosarum]
MEDSFLLRFLRVRKFDVQRALTTMLKYYKFNKEYSRIYTNFLPSEMRRILDMNVLTVLPKRHPCGALISYIKCGNLNLTEGTMIDVVALGIIITEIYLLQETAQVCGVHLIIDFKDCTFQQVYHILSIKFLT